MLMGTIIGISYERMDESKRNLSKARDDLEAEKMSLNIAESQLEFTGSQILASQANVINGYIKKADSRILNIDKVTESIDYAVRRFNEVDEGIASRINSINSQSGRGKSLLTTNQTLGVSISGTIVPVGTNAWNGYNIPDTPAAQNSGVSDYLKSSGKQLLFGNYTDDVTVLGTGAQIATGIFGVDAPGDIRDISADFVNWKWSWGHTGKTVLDTVALLPLVGVLKYGDEVVTLFKGADKVKDATKVVEAGGDVLKTDAIKVVSEAGGKIPVEDFKIIRNKSIHNIDADSITLGKYTPTVEKGVENWAKAGPDSYISKAGKNSTYFDLGSEFENIQNKYNLTGEDMFEYFNVPALDDAVSSGKVIQFSHKPDLPAYQGSYLEKEWKYLQEKHGYSILIEDKGGIWYAE